MHKRLIALLILTSTPSLAEITNSLISHHFEELVIQEAAQNLRKLKTIKDLLYSIHTESRTDLQMIQLLVKDYGHNPMPEVIHRGATLILKTKSDKIEIEAISSLERIYKINGILFQADHRNSAEDTVRLIQRYYLSRKPGMTSLATLLKLFLGAEANCAEAKTNSEIQNETALVWGALTVASESTYLQSASKKVLSEERPDISKLAVALENKYGKNAKVDLSCYQNAIAIDEQDRPDFSENTIQACCSNKANDCEYVVNTLNSSQRNPRVKINPMQDSIRQLKMISDKKSIERSIASFGSAE